MKQIILLFLLFISGQTFGQNYIEYQKVFNRIDDDVLSKNYTLAIERLDSIYGNYEFIFAKHCIKALQICSTINDSINADKWLSKCFKQGIPLWIIRTNDLTKKSLLYETTQNTIQKYDSLYTIYKSSINVKLSKQIDSLIEIDQTYTIKMNDGFFLFRRTIYTWKWLNNNKRQYVVLKNIIEKYGYPGERLIGLDPQYNDSAAFVKTIFYYGPVLIETRTYTMLLHCYSSPRKDINDKLFENLKNGNILPYQFGVINDFLAYWEKRKVGDYQYYNVANRNANNENIQEINIRRHSIGLDKYEHQVRIKLLSRERRKNKKANSEIILEWL